MKKLLCLILALAMVLSLAACGSSSSTEATAEAETAVEEAVETADADVAADAAAANDPAVTLVYAEVNPLDTIVGMTDQYFADKVNELSGGSVTIDVQASGVLGSETDVLDGMMGGTGAADMSRISAFALSTYGCTKAQLLALPYTWANRDHWWAFANSDLAQEFLNEPQEVGLPVRGVFYGEEGFRSFFFVDDDIATIDDLAGLKIRVSNDPIMVAMVEALGANATSVSMTELYSALQSGVVDAAEQPIANYASNKFNEVANTLVLDEHTLGAIQAIITDDAWNKLTENQQAALMEAGKAAQEYNAQISAEKEAEVLEQLKADGCNVVEVPDKTEWAERCSSADAIAEAINTNPDLYQQLLDFAA